MKSVYGQDRTRHTVHFDPAVEASMREIHDMLCRRWRLSDKPSLSLLLAGVVREFAESMKEDPDALGGLMAEIRARGGAVGKRDQFRRDGDPAKLAELDDRVAKVEAVEEAHNILRSQRRRRDAGESRFETN